MMDKIRWIWRTWRPLRAWFFVLLGMTAISTTVAVAYPLVIRSVLDSLNDLGRGELDARGIDARVWSAVLMLMGVGLARFVANFYPCFRGYLNYRIEWLVRARYFGHVLDKGTAFFQRFRTGDLVTRLTDDIAGYPHIAWFCCSGIFRALDSGSKVTFCLAVMAWMDWRLTLLAVTPLPFMILIFVAVKRRLGERVVDERASISATNERLEASFSGIRSIKAHDAGGLQAEALAAHLAERVEVQMRVARLKELVDALYHSLNVCGQVLVVGAGGILVIRGELSPGTFYAFYAYLGMIVAPLLDIPNLFVTGRQAFVCIDREEELRLADQEGEGGAFQGERVLDRFDSLRFKAVDFSFPGAGTAPAEEPVLKGIELELKRGERVAIVGRLGSGKSTLLRLAGGVYEPCSGQVLFNGHPLNEHEIQSFGARVGVVTQTPILFSESIRENVIFGRQADEALLAEVLEAVGLKDEVAALPKGLDQLIGQRGVSLSGGQRQRLAIARAIYGRPELLLLDDLTSALDANNERRLWARLGKLCPEVSILVVTHRIATARAMDRIAVLEEGRIVAAGSHGELMTSSPLYGDFLHEHERTPVRA